MSKFHFYSIAALLIAATWGCPAYADDASKPATGSLPVYPLMASAKHARVKADCQKADLADSEALKIAQLNAADQQAIAECWSERGLADLQRGRFDDAYRHLDRALKIYRQQSPSEAYADALHVVGRMWQTRGDVHESIRALAKSVSIYTQVEGSSHLKLAHAYSDLAQANIGGGALELVQLHANSALALCEAGQWSMAACKGEALAGIGDAYLEAGDLTAALEKYQEVLAALQLELGSAHIRTLAMQAKVAVTQAKLSGDLSSYEAAIKVLQTQLLMQELSYGSVSVEVADTLNNLACLHNKIQANELALIEIERAIAIREKIQGMYATSLVAPLITYANILKSSAQFDEMLAQVSRALGLGWADVSYRETLALYDLLVNYAQAKNNPQAAIYFSKRAAEKTLTGGRVLRLANQSLGRNFVAVRSTVFRNLIANLFQQGRLVEAQDAMDLLKENEYLDFVGEVGNEMRTAELNAFEEQKKHQFNAAVSMLMNAQYLSVQEKKRNEQASTSITPDLLQVQEQKITSMRSDFDAFLKDFFIAFKQTEGEPATPPAEDVASADAKLKMLTHLGHAAVMLHYFVAEQSSTILLTTTKGRSLHKLDIAAEALQKKVKSFLDAVQNPRRDPLPLAQDLYQILIAPIAANLQDAQAQTLLFSLDSVLHQLPMAALHDGKRYLVQQFNLSLQTQAQTQTERENFPVVAAREVRIGALGLTHAVQGFRALPGVKRELLGIVKQGKRGVFPGEVLFDDAFTEKSLQKILAKNYPALHVASHFVFKPGRDADSFLLMGDGSQLSVSQLKQGGFDFSHTDLLTLSACDTDTTGKNLNGLEVEGLGAVLQKRGARSILATKWAIEDQSTAIFMPNFYRNWSRHFSKAQALRLAQRAFIEDEISASSRQVRQRGAKRIRTDHSAAYLVDPKRPYAHPYYWAAFVLMGNWW